METPGPWPRRFWFRKSGEEPRNLHVKPCPHVGFSPRCHEWEMGNHLVFILGPERE